MKNNQIFKFLIDNFKFFSDEFLKQKNVSILINIVKSVDISSDRSANLPSVRIFQTFQTVGIGMNVFKFTNVYEIFTLNEHGKQFEETSDIAFFWC